MSSKKKESKETIEDLSVEESFGLLDEITEQMEDEELSLEEAFASFERGMKILKAANEKIDRVEKQVKVINEEGGLDEFQ